jgi:hypothetical protein
MGLIIDGKMLLYYHTNRDSGEERWRKAECKLAGKTVTTSFQRRPIMPPSRVCDCRIELEKGKAAALRIPEAYCTLEVWRS